MDLEKVTKIAEKLPDTALKLGMGFAGYRAMGKHPMGFIYGLMGWKLAMNTGASGNVPNISRVAGLAILTQIGLINGVAGEGLFGPYWYGDPPTKLTPPPGNLPPPDYEPPDPPYVDPGRDPIFRLPNIPIDWGGGGGGNIWPVETTF